jgi:hypothetical protein
VRQLLADKVQGNLLGLWLLVPEHLRLGTWDLLCGWTGQPPERVEPRLALQLIHEAVLCTSGFRSDRSLTQGGGLELANGLPFLASDTAVHELLAQAALHPLRTRLGEPVCGWEANHLAKDFFRGLEGDVRVQEDTIVVTYYNAPHASHLRQHYENLPHKLREENLNPQVPWLYGFKLDFRFR